MDKLDLRRVRALNSTSQMDVMGCTRLLWSPSSLKIDCPSCNHLRGQRDPVNEITA